MTTSTCCRDVERNMPPRDIGRHHDLEPAASGLDGKSPTAFRRIARRSGYEWLAERLSIARKCSVSPIAADLVARGANVARVVPQESASLRSSRAPTGRHREHEGTESCKPPT